MQTRYINRVIIICYVDGNPIFEDSIEVYTETKLLTAFTNWLSYRQFEATFDIEKLEVIKMQKTSSQTATVLCTHTLTDDDIIDEDATFRRYGIISTQTILYTLKFSIKNVVQQ